MPNRTVQPLETWGARMPLLMKMENQRQVQDIHLTCTYEGVRTGGGREEAFIRLTGMVKGRGTRANTVYGKASGHALFDVAKGFLTQVKVTISSELEIEEAGMRVLLSDENLVTRTEGNSLGIAAATTNQPASPPVTGPRPITGPSRGPFPRPPLMPRPKIIR